jgi:heat shock protein HtpX
MLFQQIEQNKRKTFFLIILFLAIVLALGAAVDYYLGGNGLTGMVITLVVMAVYVPLTVASSRAQVLGMSGAKQVSEAEYPQLYNIIEELTIPAQIPMPKIYVVQDDAPNAFATGLSPKSGAVAFTTGLLDRLDREELEAVAAHEIGHIRNYDIRLMTISIALVGVVALIVDFGVRMLFRSRGGDRKNNGAIMIVGLVFMILAPLIAQFVHFAVSRNREFLADASAVEFTRNPVGLISALRKISSTDPRLHVEHAREATASMYIANPFNKDRKSSSFRSWFATHPPIEARIARLEMM